ncbi:unnamed protein product [Lepeophtheirus salmonis]|uniref:(salmon louse) hypothetical protein n=1 Tax=Lepeophtheirus salmonis TaxID=72036 RepID=A0A817FEB3_LEPSM|nr:unnamed protein product [Lepeophtheirus salmonis]CAG9478423.1 unnamed protein product [Lepeophtheirus salmonis]
MDDQDRDHRKDCSNMDDLDLSFESDEENIRPITSKPPKSVVSLEEPKGAEEVGEESPVIRGEQAGNAALYGSQFKDFIEGKYCLGKDQHDELESLTVNRELRRLEERMETLIKDNKIRSLLLGLRDPVEAAKADKVFSNTLKGFKPVPKRKFHSPFPPSKMTKDSNDFRASIWKRLEEKEIEPLFAWIPSKENVEADFCSREALRPSEFVLWSQILNMLTEYGSLAKIDYFTSSKTVPSGFRGTFHRTRKRWKVITRLKEEPPVPAIVITPLRKREHWLPEIRDLAIESRELGEWKITSMRSGEIALT